MFTDFRNRLTYFGTLDDVVYRYPWQRPIDVSSIQHQLITSAIYDKKILINDGYLVANPQLLGDLEDIDRSLIGNLMMTGAARLFARGGKSNLAEGIEKQAGKVRTHSRIVQGKRWRVMRDDLEFLSKEVGQYTVPWPADKNMGEIFYRLMERVRALSAAGRVSLMLPDQFRDFDAIFSLFDKNIGRPDFDGARTVWEDQCWIYFSGAPVTPESVSDLNSVKKREVEFEAYDRVRAMMNIANEMYHLAYTIAAYHTLQTDGSATDIDPTTMGISSSVITALPDLLGPEAEAEEATQREAFEHRQRLELLNQLLIAIPPDLKFRDDFFFVTRLKTNGECRRSRSEYLEALRLFVEGRLGFGDASKVRSEYVRHLKKLLSLGLEANFLEYFASRAIDMFVIPFDMMHGGLGTTLGKMFLLPIGVDRVKNLLVERLMEARVDAALAQAGVEATQDARAVPLARRLGLYLGPIKTGGSEKLLSGISPHPATKAVA
ncbi:MAG TPA: hypothetical protein VIM56_11345 [Rhizomicrobium sp.]